MGQDESDFRSDAYGPAGVGNQHPPRVPWWFRLLLVIAGLAAWFGTQALIGRRGFPEDGKIGDLVLTWTAPVHAILLANPPWSRALLIVSSALIDALGIFLLVRSVFGPTIRPFLGLLLLLGMRQIMQAITALPPPGRHDLGRSGLPVAPGHLQSLQRPVLFGSHGIGSVRLRGAEPHALALARAVCHRRGDL